MGVTRARRLDVPRARWHAHPYNRSRYYRMAAATAPRLPRPVRTWLAERLARRPRAMAEKSDLGDHKYVSLVTFRRDGTPVPTPLWVVRYGGELGCLTYSQLAKVKRIRANPAVTVAPCTLRGKVRGEAVPGTAEIVSAEETATIRSLVDEKYGFLGRFITRRGARRADPMIGIRITLD